MDHTIRDLELVSPAAAKLAIELAERLPHPLSVIADWSYDFVVSDIDQTKGVEMSADIINAGLWDYRLEREFFTPAKMVIATLQGRKYEPPPTG